MTDYAGVLADLKAKLASLDAERSALVTAIGAIERLNRAAGEGSTAPQRGFTLHSPGKQDTMPDAIERVLDSAGRMMETPEIVTALKASGFKASPKTYRAQVYNTLWRLAARPDSAFTRNGNRWGLKKWA